MLPPVIVDAFAALMLMVAAASASRLWMARARLARGGTGEGTEEGAGTSPDVDVAHVLMAIAMAGMLTSRLATLPDAAWEVLFGVLTAWFAWRVARDWHANGLRALAGGHCAPHLLHAAAMLYMFLARPAAMAGGSGMSGMAGTTGTSGAAGTAIMAPLSDPTIAFVLALALTGYGVWDMDRVSGRRYWLAVAGTPAGTLTTGTPVTGTVSASRAVLLSPGARVCCQIAMGITMALMLVVAI